MTHQHRGVDVAVIIALQEEFNGLAPVFPGFDHFFRSPAAADGLKLFKFVDRFDVERTGCVAIIGKMGTRNAFAEASRVIELMHPKLLVNVGIAGCLDSQLRIGDVVIADEVDNYDNRAKVTGDKVGFSTLNLSAGAHFSIDNQFATDFKEMDQRFPILRDHWAIQSARRFQDGFKEQSSELLSNDFVHQQPRIAAGPIASGESVVSSALFKQQLRDRNRAFLAVDMESAGILHSAREPGLPVVVIKAISDLADSSKGELDDKYKNRLRAWAMTNALDCLHGFLTGIAAFGDHESAPRPETLLIELKSVSVGHMKKRHRAVNPNSQLPRFDRLFATFCSKPDGVPFSFAQVAATVFGSSDFHPLQVRGVPGTGKTAFLSMLYFSLIELPQTAQRPVLYVNLKRHLSSSAASHPERPPAAIGLSRTLACLERLLASGGTQPQRVPIVILDGIDEYRVTPDDLERLIVDGCRDRAALVTSVGLNYLGDRAKFQRSVEWMGLPESTVSLNELPVSDPSSRAFFEAFVALEGADDQVLSKRMLGKALELGVRSIDVFSADLIRRSLTLPRYAKARFLSEVMQACCMEFLEKGQPFVPIDEVAKLAFRYCVGSGTREDNAESESGREAKLIHSHPHMTDYLIAHHVVRTIRRLGRSQEPHDLADLDFVFPQSVTRFAKSIMNASKEVQQEVLRGAKVAWSFDVTPAKTQTCYLVGRITDSTLRDQAIEWLRSCVPQLEQMAKPAAVERQRKQLGLLARTVYISLSYLGDDTSADEYLSRLFRFMDWNDINRGFHLEYYGDIPFHPEDPLSHSDTLGPFPKSRSALTHEIRRHLAARVPNRGLFNIDVFTLFSLAQHRHSAGVLEEPERVALAQLADELLVSGSLSTEVLAFIRLLHDSLQNVEFPPAIIVRQLGHIKSTLRGGWTRRSLPLERSESVAEHMYCAWLLAWLLLPSSAPDGWPTYNKDRVLHLILIHDLHEAITGDVPAKFQDGEFKQKERETLTKLDAAQTYPGIHGLAGFLKDWDECEKGLSEEGKIAKDFDKIDNLVQLHAYAREVQILDFADWRRGLVESVRTKPGRAALDALKPLLDS